MRGGRTGTTELTDTGSVKSILTSIILENLLRRPPPESPLFDTSALQQPKWAAQCWQSKMLASPSNLQTGVVPPARPPAAAETHVKTECTFFLVGSQWLVGCGWEIFQAWRPSGGWLRWVLLSRSARRSGSLLGRKRRSERR